MRLRHLALLGAGLALLPPPTQAGAQTLDQLTEAALRHSPAIAAAQARAKAANANLDYARAQRLPDLTAQGQIGTGRIDPKGFFGLQAAGTTPRVGQVDAEMPLVTFGRIGGGIAQARGGSKAAQLMAQQARLNLRVEVAQAYSQAVAAKRLAKSYDLLRLSLTEVVRQSKLKFKAGSATSTDIAQAEARLAEAEAGYAGANGQLATAMAQLRTLSGIDVTLDEALPMPPQVPATRDEAIAMALDANPQLLAAEQAVEAARGKERAAKAEHLPMIGAYAQASSVRDQFFPGYTADSAEIGLRLKWNFFSSGRTGAKSRAASSELDAAQADYDEARLRTEQAAITAFDNHQTAKLMLTAAQARDKAAKEALRGTKLEVEAGAKPQLAQLDAEREAIEAEAALAKAQGQLIASAYQLRAVAGME
jgi:outer membrane protein